MKLNKIIIIGLFVLLSMSMAFAEICVQETANESTVCGGLPSGSYELDNFVVEAIDGDYDTYSNVHGDDIDNIATLLINYSKPNNAVITNSIWHIKTWPTVFDLVIPNNCWNQEPLQLSVVMNTALTTSHYSCFNGTSFEEIQTGSEQFLYEEAMYWDIAPENSAPIINSITPDVRLELTQGESQLYTSDVTDNDGDATYSWKLGGIEVSTTDSYLATWGDITPGIYTLELEVSDTTFSDTTSTTLEIRAKGGEATSSLSVLSVLGENEIDYEDTISTRELIQPEQQSWWTRFLNWIKGLIGGNK